MNEEVYRILLKARDDIQDVLFDLYSLDNPEGDNREEREAISAIKKQIEKMLDEC